MFHHSIESCDKNKSLTNADYEYLLDKTLHSRYIAEHMKDKHDDVSNYERVKTIITYVRQLQATNEVSFYELSVGFNSKENRAAYGVAKFTSKNDVSEICINKETNEIYQLIYLLFAYNDDKDNSHTFDIAAKVYFPDTNEEKIELIKAYPINCDGIISYDMIFDQPQKFIYKIKNSM